MRYIKLYEEFQIGDLNFMSPEEIQELFMRECGKETPDINLIRVILDNGLVDVNVKGNYDNSALHWAAYKNIIALANLLISAGADVNAKNNIGMSPLHYAVRENKLEIAKLLISAGADVNAETDNGNTPLYWAFCWDNKEMQDLLIEHGAF